MRLFDIQLRRLWLALLSSIGRSSPQPREDLEEYDRQDHKRAYEIAKAQAEFQRWSGPH